MKNLRTRATNEIGPTIRKTIFVEYSCSEPTVENDSLMSPTMLRVFDGQSHHHDGC